MSNWRNDDADPDGLEFHKNLPYLYSMFARTFFYVITLAGLLSCQRVEKIKNVAEASTETILPEPKRLPQDLQILSISESNDAERPWLDDYRFGKFFQDRAEFFVIQNSNSTIFNTPVNTVVLYYLDGEHCKTKFIVADDISSQLLDEYGNFKIIPLDDETKEVLSKEDIVVTENEKKVINRALAKYELLWKLNNKVVRFRVDRGNPTEPFVYTEQVPHYDNLYRNLEASI